MATTQMEYLFKIYFFMAICFFSGCSNSSNIEASKDLTFVWPSELEHTVEHEAIFNITLQRPILSHTNHSTFKVIISQRFVGDFPEPNDEWIISAGDNCDGINVQSVSYEYSESITNALAIQWDLNIMLDESSSCDARLVALVYKPDTARDFFFVNFSITSAELVFNSQLSQSCEFDLKANRSSSHIRQTTATLTD